MSLTIIIALVIVIVIASINKEQKKFIELLFSTFHAIKPTLIHDLLLFRSIQVNVVIEDVTILKIGDDMHDDG